MASNQFHLDFVKGVINKEIYLSTVHINTSSQVKMD